MPISETTVQSKANDYHSWLKLAGVGIAILVILGIIVLIYSIVRSNSASVASTQAAPVGSIAAVDVSNPQDAVTKINSQLTEAVKGINGTDPNAALSTLLNTLLGNTGNATTSHIGFTYNMEDGKNKVDVQFLGDIQKNADNTTAIQGAATIHAQTTQTPDITVPIDLVLSTQRLYIRLNAPTGTELPKEYAFLGLLQGKWLKIDLQSYMSLPGVAGSTTAKDVMDSTKRQQLVDSWTTNPPFINPRRTDDRKIGDATLQCLLADMNPNAFKDTTSSKSYPPTEICSNNGGAPVYLGVQMTTGTQKITVGVTVFSFGQPVTITEPTQDVVDLSGLLGSGTK